MSRKKIEKPKVFISYAWSNKEYEDMVLSFAQRLMQDGIDVVFDKWDLSEGNDTYAYMEKCVNDKTITNVLILLDPVYAEKANNHVGGVGTETQIISAKVYKQVEQSKFIPILMLRDKDGNVCKPTYLEGRLHFDLTNEEEYEFTYKRLIKTLYGEEVYKKPELGSKPSWVEEQTTINPKLLHSYDGLSANIPDVLKKDKYIALLNDMINIIKDFDISAKINTLDGYIDTYAKTKQTRLEYLQLLEKSIYITDSHIDISTFFEKLKENIVNIKGSKSEIVNVFIHEIFIYTIAFYLKKENYIAVGYILGKTYFNSEISKMKVDSYAMFNSKHYHNNLDEAMCKRDNKLYYCGTASYWIENIDIDCCNIDEFVFADIICFNYSIYGSDYISSWKWFPLTYIYSEEEMSKIEKVSKKLVSKENANKYLPLFGYKTLAELKDKMKKVEEEKENIVNGYTYRFSFNRAPIISDYIKIDDIGKLK